MFAPIRHVLPLLVSAFLMVSGVALGLLLTPLRANAEGWTPGTIGLIAAVYSCGFTLGCIVAPRVVRLLGHVRAFVVMILAASLLLILIASFVHPWSWALLRGLTGFSVACAYAVIEGWLNERSPDADRGLVFSWYMLACLAGIIVGQYALPLSSPEHATLFLLASAFFISAIWPLALSSMPRPHAVGTTHLDLARLAARAPAAVVGNAVTGMVFASWTSFAALYAKINGYGGGGIATLLMCATLGGLAFQFPVGRLSDKMDRRAVMAMIGGAGLILSVAIALWMPVSPLALGIVYFLFGATLHPSYAVNVAHANDKAPAGSHVSVSAAMLVTFGLGTMIGPPVAGYAIDLAGYRALFLWLGLGYATYCLFPLWRIRMRAARAKADPITPAGAPPV
jgi:MFS family permease